MNRLNKVTTMLSALGIKPTKVTQSRDPEVDHNIDLPGNVHIQVSSHEEYYYVYRRETGLFMQECEAESLAELKKFFERRGA